MQTNAVKHNDAWQACLAQLKTLTPAEEFERWLMPILPISFDGSELRLRVPNLDFAKQLESKYIKILYPVICKSFGEKTHISYAVPKAKKDVDMATSESESEVRGFARDTKAKLNPFLSPGIIKKRFETQLNKDYTFENFIEGECNRLVRSASYSVALEPGNKSPFNPLYIYGDSGLGKTHVAQAIGNEICQRYDKMKVLYVAMSKFQSQYQAAVMDKVVPDFIQYYQSIDVLILDDIQELAGKPGTQSAFFSIFNHLQMTGRQLVLVSDKPPVEMKDIEERLLTRFKWGLSARITMPDEETRARIIRAKAQLRGTTLPDDVVNFLAANISTNIREIEGAISALIANAKFLGKRVSTSLAKDILQGYVAPYQKEITIDHIIETVCRCTELERKRICSNERTHDVALARQIAMYIAKSHTKMPLSAIGSSFGNRSHATVLHSCNAITNLIDTNREMRQRIEEITRMVIA